MPWASVAQLLERGLASRSAPSSAATSVILALRLRGRASEPQVVDEREQPLLRAVVQVALESPPRGVTGLDDARARCAQVVELVQQLGLQALVLDGEAGGGADVTRELVLGDGAAGVRDEGDAPVAANDPRHRAIGARDGLGRRRGRGRR